MKFVADSMLGKLAKWLRVLGYDTEYQRHYRPGAIDQLVNDGRHLLSRHREMANRFSNSVLLNANHVGEQLAELRVRTYLIPERSNWFSRCLICNAPLKEAQVDEALENVPDYVFHQNVTGIRYCPLCKRYYWPGSHRTRMLRQLEQWGF